MATVVSKYVASAFGGALTHVPIAGPIAKALIERWVQDQEIQARVEAVVRSWLAGLPTVAEPLALAAVEGAAAEAMRRLPVAVQEDVARRAQALADGGEASPSASLDLAVEVIGRVLEDPEARHHLASLVPHANLVEVAVGTVLNDRYEVLGLLGVGGMGSVYRARDRRLQREVAVKFCARRFAMMEPWFRKQFEREAMVAAQLDHPAVVRVHDVISVDLPEVGSVPGIVMDLVPGPSLRTFMASKGGRLTWTEARPLVEGVLSAVDYAHGQRVLHLDLKPENVLVSGSRAKVVDFGLGRRMADGASSVQQTVVMGTPRYMAPEQAEGKAVGATADVYSLGVLLHEVLSGAPPDRDSPPPLGTEVPPAVAAAIRKAMEKEPTKRHASVAELLRALGSEEQARPPATGAAAAEGAITVRFDLDPAFLPGVVAVLEFLAKRDPRVARAVADGNLVGKDGPSLVLADSAALKSAWIAIRLVEYPESLRVRAWDVTRALEEAYNATPEGRAERQRLVHITVTNPTPGVSVGGPNVTVEARVGSEGRVVFAKVRLSGDSYEYSVTAPVVAGIVSANFEDVVPGKSYTAEVDAENEHGGRGQSSSTFAVTRQSRSTRR